MRSRPLMLAMAGAWILGGAAIAQGNASAPPEVQLRGNVKQFTSGPQGQLNGLLLENGQQVQFPAMVAERVVNAGILGHDVQVTGIRAPGQGPLIEANVIDDLATGGSIAVNPIARTRQGVGGSGEAGIVQGSEARVTPRSPACEPTPAAPAPSSNQPAPRETPPQPPPTGSSRIPATGAPPPPPQAR